MSELVSPSKSSQMESFDKSAKLQSSVVALLDAAGLHPDADELDFFFSMYAELRASADRLYGYGGDLEPAPVITVSHLYGEETHP